MAKNEIFSSLSVDKILEDVKQLNGEKEMKVWSLSDVDALLAEEADPVSETPPASFSPVQPAPVAVAVPPAEEKAAPTSAQLPKQNPPVSVPVSTPSTPAATQPQETETSLKAQAKRVPLERNTSDIAELQAEFFPEETVAEPVEPLLSGVTPQTEAAAPTETPEAKPAPIPGQISIEKTRVFNEVQPHAVYNAEIPHQIGNKVLRTVIGDFDPVVPKRTIETDEQRERFLNRPQQKLEKTQEHKRLAEQLPPKTIEKPGFIVQKPETEQTGADGLQAIPTLLLPEDVLKAQKVQTAEVKIGDLHSAAHPALETEPLAEQIVLDGFSDAEEEVERIDEEQAEMHLLARRREKAKKFRLFPGLETEETDEIDEFSDAEAPQAVDAQEKTRVRLDLPPQLPQEEALEAEDDGEEEVAAPRRKRAAKPTEEPVHVLREFYGPKDMQAVYDIFLAEQRRSTVQFVLALIMLLAGAASALLLQFTESFAWFGDSASVYCAVHAVLLLITAAFSAPQLKTAVVGLVHRRVTAETGLLVALLFALLQAGVSFAYPQQLTAVPLYTAVAELSFVFYYGGRRSKTSGDIAGFTLVAEHYDDFSSICRVAPADAAFEIGRGLLLGDPDVRYSKPIAFPTGYVATTKRNDRALDVYPHVLPVAVIAATIIGAVTCFVARDVFTGISAMVATVLAGMPIAAVAGAASALGSVNKRLESQNSLLAGYDAAFDAQSANAVVLDASDLFAGSLCRLCGMKMYHKMRVDEAILYTAAMTIQSGGTLSSVFDAVILSKREMLPEVESLAYEERLGCSGWIYNQRVLVGNRDLLLKHNVEAPTREEEQRFRKDGCELLYLAVEGKTAALFVVEYASNGDIAGYLQQLEKYGVSILLRTADPNITEGLVEQYFDLPHNLVKVINPVAGDMFCELREEPPREEPCGILHGRDNVVAALRALLSAFVLEEKYKLSQILLYIGVGLSVLFMAVLSFFSGLAQAGVAEVLVFEVVWAAIVLLIPKIKRI